MTRSRAAALACLAVAVTAPLLPALPSSAAVASTSWPAATGTATSTITWRPCAGSGADAALDCGRLIVPRDRTRPDGPTFSLALARHRATGSPEQRIGSLVFDPGGPGGSGVGAVGSIWSQLPASVQQRFDLVGWDPRGVGATTPALVGCATPWPARPATGPVSWPAVAAGFAKVLGAANAACQRRNAAIVEHMGTMEAVEDLDRIRAAVGDEKLTYWGLSYGTRIGYVYALLHPDRVRALVFDGSIDPASTVLSLTEGGAGPDQAFGSFLQAQPAAGATFRTVLAELQKAPIALPDGSRFDRWSLIDLVFDNVAQQAAYGPLAQIIDTTAVALGPAGAARDAALKTLQGFHARQYAYNSNAGAVFSIVNCLDYPQRPTLAQSVAAVRSQVRLAPYYGGTLTTAYSLGCSGLRLTPDPVPVITGPGPQLPVLIAGATRDGSTVVQWTARMSRAFPASRTVTYAGGQHVVFALAGSACVNAVVSRYLLTTRLPAMDVGCPNVLKPA